jgi:hypothetical protein
MERRLTLNALKRDQPELIAQYGKLDGKVLCTDAVPFVGEREPHQFFILGNMVSQVIAADRGNGNRAPRVRGRFRDAPKCSNFYGFDFHDPAIACGKHHFELVFHDNMDTIKWTPNTLRVFYTVAEQFKMSDPVETAKFYVIYDPDTDRWGYGITRREEGRLTDYRKSQSSSIVVWRIWKTQWPSRAINALENAVRAALALYVAPGGTTAEWYSGPFEDIDKTVTDLLSVFGAKVGKNATEVRLQLGN